MRRDGRSRAAAAYRTTSRWWSAPGPPGAAVRFSAEAPSRDAAWRRSSACASPWASTTSCSTSTARFRRDPLIGAGDPAPAVAAAAPAARAVRGAGLGDLRAADRVRPRGARSSAGSCAGSGAGAPAARCAAPPSAARLAGRAPGRAGGLRPRRQALDRDGAGGPRGGLRARGPGHARARLAAAAARSRTSAPGRWRCWPSAARAATTSSRRATSPT